VAWLRSGDGPLRVPARPSSINVTVTAGQRAQVKSPGERTREVTLDTRSLYGHSGQKPKAAREAARTGRGPSPARCGRSPGSLHQTYKTPTLQVDAFLTRLQDTTAEIRVRIAVALLIGFVALAAKAGLQTILGAFLAGVVLNLVDRDTASHPVFRSKLDGLGYGFLIPVFFVSSGVEFDLGALTRSPSALARIPLFLLALLIARGAPAALYAHTVGSRGAVAAGFLQATSLPVIVTAASIGVATRVVAPVTASALVAAGLMSVLAFPLIALTVIRAGRTQTQPFTEEG